MVRVNGGHLQTQSWTGRLSRLQKSRAITQLKALLRAITQLKALLRVTTQQQKALLRATTQQQKALLRATTQQKALLRATTQQKALLRVTTRQKSLRRATTQQKGPSQGPQTLQRVLILNTIHFPQGANPSPTPEIVQMSAYLGLPNVIIKVGLGIEILYGLGSPSPTHVTIYGQIF